MVTDEPMAADPALLAEAEGLLMEEEEDEEDFESDEDEEEEEDYTDSDMESVSSAGMHNSYQEFYVFYAGEKIDMWKGHMMT